MKFLLLCLLYAFFENEIGFLAYHPLVALFLPLAFLLLAPIVHRLRLNALPAPFEETIHFPAKNRWFCAGVAVFLVACLLGTVAELSAASAIVERD